MLYVSHSDPRLLYFTTATDGMVETKAVHSLLYYYAKEVMLHCVHIFVIE